MTTMQALWDNGRWVDLALSIVLAEVLILGLWVQVTGRQTWFRGYLLNLASGLCLMFALRATLTHSGWELPALWLALSGLIHGADLWARWHQQADRDPVRPR